MIPVRLSIKNFLCYKEKDQVLELEGIHVACLCGNNGHGKSAILDAITWALWGYARGKKYGRGESSIEDLISQGRTNMEIELDFESKNTNYRVIRKYAKGSRPRSGQSILELQISDGNRFKSITENSLLETDQKIQRLLGMDYDTFANSAFLIQGEADRFTKSKPTERKETLSRILGLSIYDNLEDRAKTSAREKAGEISVSQKRLEAIESDLVEHEDLDLNLKQAVAEFDAVSRMVEISYEKLESIRSSLAQSQGLIDKLNVYRQHSDEEQAAIETLKSEIESRELRVKDFEQNSDKMSKLKKEREICNKLSDELSLTEVDLSKRRKGSLEIQNQKNLLNEANTRLKNDMKELRAKVDLLNQEGNDPQCPLCSSELGEEGCIRLASKYADEGKEKAESYRENDQNITRLEKECGQEESFIANSEQQLTNEKSQLETRIINIERDMQSSVAAKEHMAVETESLGRQRQLLEKQTLDLARNLSNIKSAEEEINSLGDVRRNFDEAKKDHNALAERREGCLSRKSVLEERLKNRNELNKAKEKVNTELQVMQHKLNLYQELALAFGKKGIQALIIESAIPELETEANLLLGRMTDNLMNIKLETQRARKSQKGDPIETLEIKASDEQGTRGYELFSGGERFRIDFAIRIALSKLLAHRSGAPLPTLFIDEGFGSQDATGRERLVECIRSIQDDFRLIMVITHIEELKNAFSVRIEVTKEMDGASFEFSYN